MRSWPPETAGLQLRGVSSASGPASVGWDPTAPQGWVPCWMAVAAARHVPGKSERHATRGTSATPTRACTATFQPTSRDSRWECAHVSHRFASSGHHDWRHFFFGQAWKVQTQRFTFRHQSEPWDRSCVSCRHDGSGLRPERSPLWERRSFPAEPPLQMYVHCRSHRLHSCFRPEACRNLRPSRTDGQQASWPSRRPEEAPARHELHVRWVFTELTCEGEQVSPILWAALHVSHRGGVVGLGFLSAPFFLTHKAYAGRWEQALAHRWAICAGPCWHSTL